jgi:CheY-like chemotaxis protein
LWDDRAVAATVVIVDDHPDFRRLARRLLSAAGLSVVDEAGDGAAGLAAVRRLCPDLVLLDVLLPDTSGLELAEVLAADPAPPAVLLTSSRQASDFGGALERSSARGFIAKRDLTVAALAAFVDGSA